MPETVQGQAGTKQNQSRDKAGTRQGQAGTFPFCPCLSLVVPDCLCLSLLVLVRPCLSLSVLFCPCLSLYVSTFAIPSCLPMQMTITVFISMNLFKLTFLAEAKVPMHANLVFNLFFTFLFCFLNISFIQFKRFYSSDKYKKKAPLGFLHVLFFSVQINVTIDLCPQFFS